MTTNFNKLIETIVFFANNAPDGMISKLHLLKMIFFADRYHMRMFARSITGDTYYAMTFGPVPSNCKKISEGKVSKAYRNILKDSLEINGFCIKAKRTARMDAFSSTDVEALRAACGLEAQKRDLIAFSHKFPEWTKHEDRIKKGGIHARAEMNPLDFFLPAPEGCEYCGADAERLTAAKEIFSENLEAQQVLCS